MVISSWSGSKSGPHEARSTILRQLHFSSFPGISVLIWNGKTGTESNETRRLWSHSKAFKSFLEHLNPSVLCLKIGAAYLGTVERVFVPIAISKPHCFSNQARELIFPVPDFTAGCPTWYLNSLLLESDAPRLWYHPASGSSAGGRVNYFSLHQLCVCSSATSGWRTQLLVFRSFKECWYLCRRWGNSCFLVCHVIPLPLFHN